MFTVTGATHTSYLRSSAVPVYQQGQWYIEDGMTADHYTDNVIQRPDIKLQQISNDIITIQPIVTFSSGFIPTALYTTRIYHITNLDYYPEIYSFKTLSSFSASYSFDTVHFDDSRMPDSALILADDIYIQIPDEITQRTRDLAEQIVRGISSPVVKARTIEQYLKTTYEYDPEYEKAPEGEEPIDWFLFTEKKGVCANFNSAFVILSRCAGVPARLVTGYSISPQEEEQIVSFRQAHAWAEVPFIDYGWITFDATPGGSGPDIGGTSDERRRSGKSTVIEITGFTTSREEGAQKGHTFIVTGTVNIENTGRPAQAISVEIYIDTVKGKGGILVGTGKVPVDSDDGEYSIECEISNEFSVGDYQIIAHAIGDDSYAESWSDPELRILSGTNIDFTLSPGGRVGEAVEINGILVEELGDPVASMPVLVDFSDNSGIQTVITDINGGFNLNHVFNDSGDFPVRVIFRDSDYYFGSEQKKSIRVMMPTVLTLDVPGEALPQDPVQVKGTLSSIKDEPLNGKEISLYIDDSLVSTVTTGNDGEFSYSQTFVDSGKHTIEARFPGQDFSLESSDTAMINIIQVVIDITSPEVFVRGEDAYISGRIFTKNGPISDETLIILMDGISQSGVTTSEDGHFKYALNISRDTELGVHTVTYNLMAYDRTRTQDVYIKSRASLTASGPESINAGEPITVVTKLLDDHETPIMGMNIITGDQVIHGPTNENGELPIYEEMAKDTKDTEIVFVFMFEETEDYLSAQTEISVPILQNKDIPLWIYLVIAGVLVAGVSGFFIYRFMINSPHPKEPIGELILSDMTSTALKEKDIRQTGIMIEFPQITSPFPDVWGVYEELDVQIKLLDVNNSTLSNKSISVGFEGEKNNWLETGAQGTVQLKPIFKDKGTFSIECIFSGDGDYLPSRAVRSVKIVDYREEIVSLYATFKDWANYHGIRLPIDITPRILEKVLVRDLTGIDERSLDNFLWHFEEADYSTHEVGRVEYENAYLSLIKVQDSHGGNDEQDI